MRGYGELYQKYINQLFRKKLGLEIEEEDDEKLVDILLAIMETVQADYTQTFRDLSELNLEDLKSGSIPEAAWGLFECKKNKELNGWLQEYVSR